MAKKKQLQITDGTNPAPPNDVIDVEFVEHKEEKPKAGPLTLEKTRAYAKALLDMPSDEVISMLRTQYNLKQALFSERMLMFIEQLDQATNFLERRAILENMEVLASTAARDSMARANLEKSIGISLLPVPGTVPAGQQQKSAEPSKELSFEEFQAQVKEELANRNK